jgi:hypothetical protein
VGRDRAAHDATPGIPEHEEPEVSLVTAGGEYDVLGFDFDEISPEDREAVLTAYPRIDFKESIIQAFADGFADKPDTTFGTMNAACSPRSCPDTCALTRRDHRWLQAQHLIRLRPRPNANDRAWRSGAREPVSTPAELDRSFASMARPGWDSETDIAPVGPAALRRPRRRAAPGPNGGRHEHDAASDRARRYAPARRRHPGC